MEHSREFFDAEPSDRHQAEKDIRNEPMVQEIQADLAKLTTPDRPWKLDHKDLVVLSLLRKLASRGADTLERKMYDVALLGSQGYSNEEIGQKLDFSQAEVHEEWRNIAQLHKVLPEGLTEEEILDTKSED